MRKTNKNKKTIQTRKKRCGGRKTRNRKIMKRGGTYTPPPNPRGIYYDYGAQSRYYVSPGEKNASWVRPKSPDKSPSKTQRIMNLLPSRRLDVN